MTLSARRVRQHIGVHRTAILDAWFGTQFDGGRLERYAVAGRASLERADVIATFLTPLLALLTEYLATGDERCRAVYLDERLRYAPHQSDIAERAAFFKECLPSDEAALLDGADAELAASLADLLRALHAPLVAEPNGPAVRLLAVGDCIMNEVRVFLPSLAAASGVTVDMRCLYFSAPVGRGISTDQVVEFLRSQPMDLLSFSFLSYEGLALYAALLREADHLAPEELEQRADAIAGLIRRFLEELRGHTETPFLLHNASGLPLTPLRRRLPGVPALSSGRQRVLVALNARIAEIVRHTPNTLLLDEDGAAQLAGHRAASAPVVPPAIGRGAQFHTSEFGRVLAEPYLDIVRSLADLRKAKVFAVDLDNTLWDGVMADGAVRHHHDRQQILRRAREAGMLLVTVSKNDPANIRWDEMNLKPDDFVLHKIAWDQKAQSIQQAAEQLNLGLDSVVLIDDNPAEREMVRLQLPMVTTLDATDPHTWRSADRVLRFTNTADTAEARQRTELYRQQALRREALSAKYDVPEMMAALQLRCRFSRARPDDTERVSELAKRTNQFNTTTIRYSRAQVQALLADPDVRVYVAELADKFGDIGIVAAAVVRRDAAMASFESVVMSCRAMGFSLEQLFVGLVIDAEPDAQRFVGRFIPTDRNTPAMSLFSDCGFRALGDGTFELGPTDPRPPRPAWFAVAGR